MNNTIARGSNHRKIRPAVGIAYSALLTATLATCSPLAYAGDSTAPSQARKDGQPDQVMQAMNDELQRSMNSLALPGKPKPYYMRYEVGDAANRLLEYSNGCKVREKQTNERASSVEVRVGTYDSDNTAHTAIDHLSMPFILPATSSGDNTYIPMDDNYWAIRSKLWLATDDRYKQVTEQLDRTEGYRRGHNVRNLCESFSHEPPNISVEPEQKPPEVGLQWNGRLRDLSLALKNFPQVRKSWIALDTGGFTGRVITSEGTRTRTSRNSWILGLTSWSRTADGEDYWDCSYVRANSESHMPAQSQLLDLAKKMGEGVAAYNTAERRNYYFGPVLFEGQAASELVMHAIAPLLCASGGDNTHPAGTLLRAMNMRVLPSFLSIADDPTLTTFQGQELMPGWNIDSEGMPCTRVQLIDHGYLRNLLASRNPVFSNEHTNGHDISGEILPTTLMVSAATTASGDELRRRLLELAKDHGQTEALIVRRIVPRTALMLNGNPTNIHTDGMHGCRPLAMYSVNTKTGEEHQIRGLKFHDFDRASLEGIVAAGDDSKAYFSVNWAGYVRSLITPSLLVRYVEMEEETAPALAPYPLRNPYEAIEQ